jgi:uncharacterized membrane protein
MKLYQTIALAVVGLASLPVSALAGPLAVPGPIAGVGLPALAVIGGAYWLGRRLLTRNTK